MTKTDDPMQLGIMAGLLVNEAWIKKFLSDRGGDDGTTNAVNPDLVGIIVACLQVAAAVTAFVSGHLCDVLGRKRCVRLGGVLYFITAFIQAFAPNLACFICGRTLQGFAVGILSMTVPIIQTEIARPHRRGLMVGIEYTFLIASYAMSCWVNYGFHFLVPSVNSWRGPFFIQLVLAFILVVMSFVLPETPRWLASNGFMKECMQTVADLHADGNIDDSQVQQVFLEIQEAVAYEKTLGEPTWKEMFTRYRKRTFMAIAGQMFAQLNGINVISFYLPSTLAGAGFSTSKSLLYTAANSIIYTAATIPTWWLADNWGRKPLLMFGGCCMAVCLAIMCAFTQVEGLSALTKANGMFAFVVLYNAFFGATWGPMPWLLPAEVFPLRARSRGVAISTTTNWLFNFIIGMSSPKAFAGIHGYYYVIILGFCLFSVGLVKFYFVETAHHTLEEISTAFGDKAFMDDDNQIMQEANLQEAHQKPTDHALEKSKFTEP
ncbi:hypothetical protein ACHAPJ_009654 [Fusarium lateritium]